jgi:adenosylcobinamide-phosphate synthase
MDKILLVVTAIVISTMIGGGLFKLLTLLKASHLIDYPAKLLRDAERKLNQGNRTPQGLNIRALSLTGIVIAVSLVAGFLFPLIFSSPIFTLVILIISLPLGSSWSRVNSIKNQLQAGNLPAAREQLNGTVFRHHAIMDEPALARASIEYLAIQFSEKIVAPIFWFMLLGVAGLFTSLAICLMQETLAGASSKPTPFGKAARDAQFLFNYVPARLATFLWVVAILFLPKRNWKETVEKISSEIITATPNNLALLCAASSLNLSLGGTTSSYCNDKWIGTGKTTPSNSDITRAQFLFIVLCLLLFLSLGFFIQ